MNSSFRKALVGAVVLGATAAGGAFAATAVVGSAQSPSVTSVDDGSTDTSGTDTATNSAVAVADDTGTADTGTADDTATADDDQPKGPHEANGITEAVLTGDTAAQATAAAEAAVPDGTVDRLETDADGATYEAHMTKADGSRVTVKLNADFTVASIETDEGGHHGHGRGGQGGPHQADGITEEALTGDTLTQATAAAQAAVPGATVDRAETDAEGAAYEVHMTNADGSHVTVKLNADFSVAGIEEGGH